MSSLASPRGPLPARVYWFRRVLVLGLAFVLVLGLARLLGGGSDGGDGGDTAVQAGSDASQSESAGTRRPSTGSSRPPSSGPSTGPTDGPSVGPTTEPPAEPEGDCAPGDISVEPTVFRPTEGDTVLIGLDVTSEEAEACYWDVSAESLTLKITSGDDDIWTTRQCPAAVPERQVVVRDDAAAKVQVEWSGRRSDDECSPATDYAMPGYYIVGAAALAGEPSSVQFQLEAPPPPVITRSPSPSPSVSDGDRDGDRNGGGSGDGDGDRGGGGRSPSASPSGAVEPDGD